MTNGVRPASPEDIARMVELAAQKRTEYESYQPVFWHPADDARIKQKPFFEYLLRQANVIALVHDVLVVLLALMITRLEFDLTTLAALLTVIGFSVHDTIIVSDRIREDATKRRRETLATVMNRAINETLSRTILTSGTAIAVLIALLALGGPILRPSAFTLLVGFITGTYSSVYIAGPVVLFWESRVNIKNPRPARAA